MQKKIKTTGFIIALILLGFFREYLFVSINAELYYKYKNETNPHPFAIEKYLSFFSYNTLYTAKWFITPAMAFIFWWVQKQFIFFLFHDKKVLNWLRILYFLLGGIAVISLSAGWLLGDINQGYVFSRLFMGLLQSPVACMVLIPVAYLYHNIKHINQ